MDRCRVYDKPGIRRYIFSILSVEDFDAPLGKPFAGGVLCAVGTAYSKTPVGQKFSQPAHITTADTDEMHMGWFVKIDLIHINTISFPALPGYVSPVGNGFCPGIFAGAFWRIILYII